MFSDEILEKIFSHPEAVKVPVGCQATMVSVIEEILEEAQKNANEFQSGEYTAE